MDCLGPNILLVLRMKIQVLQPFCIAEAGYSHLFSKKKKKTGTSLWLCFNNLSWDYSSRATEMYQFFEKRGYPAYAMQDGFFCTHEVYPKLAQQICPLRKRMKELHSPF